MDLFRCSMSPDAGPAVAKLYTPDTNGRTYVGQGPKVDEFEHAFGSLIGLERPPLGVNSCSAAIDLALHLIGVGPGDEVITTPLTCSATNGSIVTRGASIVWADVDPITGLIDPVSVASALTSRTKAVIAVDWAGRFCDYGALQAISDGVPIIEDAAHCVYTPVIHGDYLCFSFGPIKHLTTGGYGGALLPPDVQYERAKLLRWHGLDRTGPSDSFRCIHPRTKVRMANGRAVPIRQLVSEKNPGPVLVYENGHLVPRKIVGWHENPREERKYLRIGLAALQGREAATVTEDHLILTREGWKRADCLTEQDEVATAYPSPSALQRQLLIGGLLGDAGMNGNKAGLHRNMILESHTARDRDYAEAKVAAFSGLGMTIVDRAPDEKHPVGMVQFWSKSLPTLSDLGRAFYPNGHKIVPRTLIETEGLSDAALAIWFMDDGSTHVHNGMDALHPYCQVASNGFSEEDVRWLIDYLDGLGLPCRALSSAGTTGWRIAFTKEGSRHLVERIARFVPPSMRYKVGHLPELEAFDPESWGTGESLASWDRVIVTEQAERSWNWGTKTYCLSVEGGAQNFVAGPIVVHNCEQDIKEAGYRYHMTDDQAVVGLANLLLAVDGVESARSNAWEYTRRLKHIGGLTLPAFDDLCNYWLFGLIVEQHRDLFMQEMASLGIPTSRVHARNDTHTAYRAATARWRALPGVDYFDSHQVNIPVGWWITPSEFERIIAAVDDSARLVTGVNALAG